MGMGNRYIRNKGKGTAKEHSAHTLTDTNTLAHKDMCCNNIRDTEPRSKQQQQQNLFSTGIYAGILNDCNVIQCVFTIYWHKELNVYVYIYNEPLFFFFFISFRFI